MPEPTVKHVQLVQCYHCGEDCIDKLVIAHEKSFCCDGCKMVFEILNKSGMCDYYSINKNPGTSQKITIRADKFSFLEDQKLQGALLSFKNEQETHINFYVPQMHCSSCLWLLENMHQFKRVVV